MGFVHLLLTSVVFNVTANILLKKGVISTGGISGEKTKLVLELTKAAVNPFIIIGLFLYGMSFLIWLRVLTTNDLSRSYPIFATLVFALTAVGSSIFLKETITVTRVIGIAIMLFGIFIVARS